MCIVHLNGQLDSCLCNRRHLLEQQLDIFSISVHLITSPNYFLFFFSFSLGSAQVHSGFNKQWNFVGFNKIQYLCQAVLMAVIMRWNPLRMIRTLIYFTLDNIKALIPLQKQTKKKKEKVSRTLSNLLTSITILRKILN